MGRERIIRSLQESGVVLSAARKAIRTRSDTHRRVPVPQTNTLGVAGKLECGVRDDTTRSYGLGVTQQTLAPILVMVACQSRESLLQQPVVVVWMTGGTVRLEASV